MENLTAKVAAQDDHDRYQCNIVALNPSNTIYLNNLH